MSTLPDSELEMVAATHRALDMLGGRWTVDVLYLLAHGRRRYSEVFYEVGEISKKGLTCTLRRLERDGLVVRHVGRDRPPRVEYSLTPLGWSVTEPMMGLYEWAAEHVAAERRSGPLQLVAA